ncbi:DcrB-related protein [Massilia genomosp. 1]|uniref:DUF1795 domain-containing protein n=1 Tax=Massilia genomosp. 1 TaxID=2609280 RepID=A0ABX0MS55_9BURK|nr:DUF1795 domain-containing protein [Massilia genomosp. 1]NHZ64902.1 DUF1795 domain-containing protein [Massilia genomosp. 1]
MSEAPATPIERIGIHEGSIGLPLGYEDRTANIFVPGDPQFQPNLSIARDWLIEGETLASYVDRQLGILKARIPNHKFIGRVPEQLGQNNPAWIGERIEAHYKNGAQMIRQRQAAFLIGSKRALIFTMASPHPFNDKLEALWRGWLDSFVPFEDTPDGSSAAVV